MPRLDPHSYADSAQPKTESIDLRARIDFFTERIDASLTLTLDRAQEGPLDLDTRELTIETIASEGQALPFEVGPADPILGARLRISLRKDSRRLTIRYKTSPSASALQWLTPEQAHGKEPFLYSQCQALHARSLLPIQDTPRQRIRYRAALEIPRRLRAVMAAAPLSREERGDVAIEHFEMPQPIPPYLFAFAVGELAHRDLSPRARVFAAPSVVEDAAWEFSGVEAMIVSAEELLGPYAWERFDLLVMP